MKFELKKLAAAAAVALVSMGAFASTATDSGTATMGVSATIAPECSIGGTVAITFGNLAMLDSGATTSAASNSNGGGAFNVICTNGTPSPQLRFTSANAGATNTFRLVGADGTSFITYTVAESSSSTSIAHDTAAAFTGLTADGTQQSLAIKASIAASDSYAKPVQAYSDTITITSSYSL